MTKKRLTKSNKPLKGALVNTPGENSTTPSIDKHQNRWIGALYELFILRIGAPLIVAVLIGLMTQLWLPRIMKIIRGSTPVPITISAPSKGTSRCVVVSGTGHQYAELKLWVWVADANGTYYVQNLVSEWRSQDRWSVRVTVGSDLIKKNSNYVFHAFYLPSSESNTLRSLSAGDGAGNLMNITSSSLPEDAQLEVSTPYMRTPAPTREDSCS